MSRAPPVVIVASSVSPHVADIQLHKGKKFVRSHVAYLSGRVFDWVRLQHAMYVQFVCRMSCSVRSRFPSRTYFKNKIRELKPFKGTFCTSSYTWIYTAPYPRPTLKMESIAEARRKTIPQPRNFCMFKRCIK